MSMQTSMMPNKCPRCNVNEPEETDWCYALTTCHESETKDYMFGCNCCEECSEKCAEEAKHKGTVIILDESV
jgi:hypothetical protein